VLGVGLAILRSRLGSWVHARAHARGEHHHHHDHHHPEPVGGLRSLVGVGISGGIVPCPTALVVLLAAISLHRVGYGLVLIVAFSVGLAASVTGIGLLAVTAKRLFSRMSFEGRLIRALPAASAVVVLALGLVMTARALPPVL
jgi:ABC-type nickel/cobalt efflux system permease component RcnA